MDLDALIDEITIDAYGEEEQLWAFRQVFEDKVAVPCEATLIGEPVQVLQFDYDGNERRGLTAACRRADGMEYIVAASEVVIPARAQGGRYLAAYRQWMGLTPFPPEARRKVRRTPPAEAAPDLGDTVELVILSVKQTVTRCRLAGGNEQITLRTGRLWNAVPGEIAVVRPAKRWTYGRQAYLSGTIESTRLDTKALGLTPLRLEDSGVWDPAKHYWGEEDDPIGEWAKPIIARGPRPQFEMEQVLPGEDPEDPFSDPIIESTERKAAGDSRGARKILMDLCQADLRCLDAHAHLGHLLFDGRPEDAIRHYEVGVRIGELSLGEDFDGLLPWGLIDNRPFLRSMSGFGLCLWRLGQFGEAAAVFDRLLWLNPTDNQGARFLLDDVRVGASWEDSQESWT